MMKNNILSLKNSFLPSIIFVFIYGNFFAQVNSCQNPSEKYFTVKEGEWSQLNGPDTSKCIQSFKIESGQIKNYYLVKSSENGTLGLIQNLSLINATDCLEKGEILSKRQARLYEVGNCGNLDIPYNQLVVNEQYSSTFNPEWASLKPSASYILEIIITVPNICEGLIESICLDVCYPTKKSCLASVGKVTVSGGTAVFKNEYDLTKEGDAISVTSSDFILPSPSSISTNSTSTYGYFVFSQKPNLPFTDFSPSAISSLPGFKGIAKGIRFTDKNLNGSSLSIPGANSLWLIPSVFDKSGGGLVLDDDGDNCFKVGELIKIIYKKDSITNICGICSADRCPIVSIKSLSSNQGNLDLSNSIDYKLNSNYTVNVNKIDTFNVIIRNFYTISLPKGINLLGVKQLLEIPNLAGIENLTRRAILRKNCNEDSINISVSNANNIKSGFNPEWHQIEGGDYVLEIITTVPKGINVFSSVAGFYFVNDSVVSNDSIHASIKNILYDDSFELYPNPSNHKLNFTKILSDDFFVLDSLGRKIHPILIDNKTIDVSNMDSGLYFIEIKDKKYQFIVNH